MRVHYYGTLFEVEEAEEKGEVVISIYADGKKIDMTEFCVWTQNQKGESLYSVFAKAYVEAWRYA